MPAFPLTGGCLCGGVRYEIDAATCLRLVLPLHPLPAPRRARPPLLRRRSRRGRSGSSRAPSSCASGCRTDHGWPKCFCSACGGALWSRSSGRGRESSASGSVRSTPIPRSARSGTSSSPTPPCGRRYPTTVCRGTTSSRRADGKGARDTPAEDDGGPAAAGQRARARARAPERDRELRAEPDLPRRRRWARAPLRVEPAFERTLGYEPHETGGVLFWDRYVPDGERAAARDCIEAAVRRQAPAAPRGEVGPA